jgi:Flp pilus assembly protein TadD
MREDRRTLVICVVLTLGTLLLYAPVLFFDFINWDDPQYVIGNFHLQDGLGWRGLAWSFQTAYGSHWIPLLWLSYMLDYQFYALNPAGYHASNVLLHTANAVLLFLLLKRMTATFWRSAMVAALFAWHPMHVESVAWIAERKDVLSTLFWMLTIWAYLNYAGKGGVGRYFLVLMFFAFGLMAKPMLVTLPFVLLLLDWWPPRRFQSETPAGEMNPGDLSCPAKTWRQLVLEKAPLLLLAAGCSLVTAVLQMRGGAIPSLAEVPLESRLLNALVSYWHYIEKIIWPVDLSVIYPLRPAWPWADIVAAVIILAAISAGAVCFRKRRPYLMLGWLWYLGTLVPVIGLMQVGAQAMADRYTYIPSIGLFIMICWGAFDLMQTGVRVLDNQLLKRHQQWVPGTLCLATLAMCGWATSHQLQYWRDSGTLFSRALAVYPDNRIGLASYGLFLFEHGSLPEAIVELRRDVQFFPEDPLGHAFLGDALYSAGRHDEAAAEFRSALKLKPDLTVVRYDLGSILLEKNLPGEAAAECASAFQYAPDNAGMHCLMGKALSMQGRLDEARQQFSEALRLIPEFLDARYQLALTLAMQHKTTEAVAQYRMALSLQSDMPDALNNLAWILATDPHPEIRNGAEAVQLARRACTLTRNTVPLMMGTLAAAYAETGHFDEAVACAQKARDLAVAQGRNEMAAKNAELLELFRAHHAYHEKS